MRSDMRRIKYSLFGGSGIDEPLYKWILENIPLGKTILEIGSGDTSTKLLSSKYNLYSIEHDKKFCGRWHNQYIQADLTEEDGWYNIETLKRELPDKYDVLMVDGPVGSLNRMPFYKYLHMFDMKATIIIHDTNRFWEKLLVDLIERDTNKKKIMFDTFGILL